VGGAGVLLYLAGMILMPVEPYVFVGGATPATPVRRDSTKFWGYLLIGLGIFWMLANIGVSFWHGWWNLDWQVILAGLLIAAGLGLILGRRSVPVTPPATGAEGEQAAPPPIPPAARKLYRSRMDRKLFGVCGGLGTYFGVDSTLVRLIVVLTVLASHGLGLLAYILLAILVPDEVVVPRVAG
jgi:phage shock protein C